MSRSSDASAVADNTVLFHGPSSHRTNPYHITYKVYSEKLTTEQSMDPGPDFHPRGSWYELSSLVPQYRGCVIVSLITETTFWKRRGQTILHVCNVAYFTNF